MNDLEKEEFWKDISRPESKIDYSYTVVVDIDGRITTNVIQPSETVRRAANTFDIYQSSKELVSDIESHLLADRIATLVAAKLQPKNAADEIKEKIINALNDRKQEAPIE